MVNILIDLSFISINLSFCIWPGKNSNYFNINHSFLNKDFVNFEVIFLNLKKITVCTQYNLINSYYKRRI